MKINKVEQIATQIVCAEIQNGMRPYWIYDFSDTKKQGIVDAHLSLITGKAS